MNWYLALKVLDSHQPSTEWIWQRAFKLFRSSRILYLISYYSLEPEAFGEMTTPLFGSNAAAGVVASYQMQMRASTNVIDHN